jgi:uncharacterized membrane protein YciS (DUF1049 family)
VVLIGYVVALVLGNRGETPVDLVVSAPVLLPLWGVIAGCVGLGAILAMALFSWPMIRSRLQLRRQSQRIARLEQEIHGLRTQPLTEDEDGTEFRGREA